MANKFKGLAEGAFPGNDNVLSVNAQADAAIFLGSAVKADAPPAGGLKPRVIQTAAATDAAFGIAIKGDAGGIYSDDGTRTSPDNSAATAAGQAVRVATQGLVLASVDGSGTAIVLDSPLAGGANGILAVAVATNYVLARAKQPSTAANDIILVDITREGTF